MKLTERDRRLLATLGPEPQDVSAVADALDRSPEDVRERLAEMAGNGLVAAGDDDRYRRTESGRRLLRTEDGQADAAVDTPPAVEDAIDGADLAPDAAEAVRAAYAFLRYWGEATTDELIDALHSEWPAGIESPEEWWAVVGDALADVRDVVRVDREGAAAPDVWRYAGTPEVTTPASDGFLATERRGYRPYGSVKHAVESLGLATDEREAVRAAFGVLRRRGTASRAEITDAVDEGLPAEYDTDEDWWDDLLAEALAELPNVERDGDARWRYEAPPLD